VLAQALMRALIVDAYQYLSISESIDCRSIDVAVRAMNSK
jgi:hypothetical protein